MAHSTWLKHGRLKHLGPHGYASSINSSMHSENTSETNTKKEIYKRYWVGYWGFYEFGFTRDSMVGLIFRLQIILICVKFQQQLGSQISFNCKHVHVNQHISRTTAVCFKFMSIGLRNVSQPTFTVTNLAYVFIRKIKNIPSRSMQTN